MRGRGLLEAQAMLFQNGLESRRFGARESPGAARGICLPAPLVVDLGLSRERRDADTRNLDHYGKHLLVGKIDERGEEGANDKVASTVAPKRKTPSAYHSEAWEAVLSRFEFDAIHAAKEAVALFA